jgi:hypothetical protein
MDKNLKITLAIIAFAVLLQYSTILAAYVCPSPAIDGKLHDILLNQNVSK